MNPSPSTPTPAYDLTGLSGLRVYLRPLEENDAAYFFRWQNDPQLYEQLVGNYMPVTRPTVEAWLNKKRIVTAGEVNLAICLNDTKQPIGVLYFREITPAASHAELHIYIGDAENRQHGFGSEAMRVGLAWAFDRIGLHRVFLHVLAANRNAIAAYERVGFKSEGTLRQHARKQGEFCDVVVMGLLREEFVR